MNYAGKFGTGGLDRLSGADVDVQSPLQGGPADTIKIPDAHLLFSGDFKRSGVDLIISDDHQRVTVPDYFLGSKRPTLVSPEGAPLDPKVIEALTGHVQYAQAGGAPAAKVVGHVSKMTGSASVVRNGVTIVLNNGDAVYQSDVVQTGSASTLGLVLIDGTTFNLTANARLMLSDLTYDAASTSNSSLFTLVQGAASFVAGQVAKTGDMKVGTPVATMGIRGTAVILDISATDGKVSISVIDQRDGLVHSVQVFNTRGDLIGTVTSNGGTLTLTPTATFEVIAQMSDKNVALVQQEFNAFQQLLNTYDIYKAIDPSTPQHTDNNANPQTRYAGLGSSPTNSQGTEFHSTLANGSGPSVNGTGPTTPVILNTFNGPIQTGSGAPLPGTTVQDVPVIRFETAVANTSIPFVVTPSPTTVTQVSSGNGDHFGPVMSADGRFVTYDPDGVVYLFDRQTGVTKVIATPSNGLTFGSPTISSDGHYVIYQRSDGLTFIYDNNPADGARYQQTTQFVRGTSVAISGNGSTILVENGAGGIGIYDLQGNLKGSITPALVGSTGALWKPAISADGHLIAFWGSDAAPAGGSGHLYTYDLRDAKFTEIATTAAGAGTSAASISANGRYVVYQTDAGGHTEIHLYDLNTHSVVFSTSNATGSSRNAVISPDGHYIVFASDAKWTSSDTNAYTDIYKVDLTDLANPKYTLISARADGSSGNAASDLGASVSLNGKIVVFGSKASDFSAGDDNAGGDIFVSDPGNGQDVIIQETAASPDILTISGAIAVTGGTAGVTISVSDSRFTAKFSDDGKFVLWTFSEAKSNFADLAYGADALRSATITLAFEGGFVTTPVSVTVHNAIPPVVTPVNVAPVIGSATLTLAEGDTVLLSPANIGIVDVDSNFTYKVSNVTHGQFQVRVNGTWYNTATFTSAELANGQVRFMHDRGEQAPTFSIQADDGHASNSRSNVLNGTVNFTHVNDAPVITAAALYVARGGTSVLDASTFKFSQIDSFADFSGFQTRPDLPPFSSVLTLASSDVLVLPGYYNSIAVNDPDSSNFTFTVSNVTHGVFQKTTDGVNWVDTTTFTSAELKAGHVRFAHDGSEQQPTFSIQADDGSASNNLSNVLVGTVGYFNEQPGIYGDAHDNRLVGTLGDDVLVGQGGNDAIDGRAGVDMAIYHGPRASYTVVFDAGQVHVTDSAVGGDGSDTLIDVELLHFSDEIDLLVSGSQANPVDISGLDLTVTTYEYPFVFTSSSLGPVISRTGSADDFLKVGQNISDHAVDLGAGANDTLYLSGTAGLTVAYDLDLQGVENLIGSAANDSVVLKNNVTDMFVDLAGGANTLYLAKGANSLAVANVQSIVVDPTSPSNPTNPASPSNDTLTLFNNVTGVSIHLGGGTNTINLAAGTNAIAVDSAFGATIVNGTDSQDSLTLLDGIRNARIDLGAGDDALTLGSHPSGNTMIPSAGNTIVYADGDGEDVINGFVHGNFIDLTGVAGVYSLADLEVCSINDGLDTIIHLGDGSSLTLTGISPDYLSDGDFIFAAAQNHAATIDGDTTGALYEDEVVSNSGGVVYHDTDSGTLTVHDVDDGEDRFQNVDSEDLYGEYGQFTFDSSSGHWTYHLNNGNPAIQALGSGDTVTDTLTVTSADGTATQDIVVTITGTNDAPVYSGESLDSTFETGSPVALVHNVVVSDVDSVSYAGGTLTADVTDARPGDELLVSESQYIQLEVQSGTRVMWDADGDGPGDAIEIGTLYNYGSGLTVQLNSNATDAAVAALTEAIEYTNSALNPEGGTRTVRFTLEDGGGTEHGGHESDSFSVTVTVPSDDEAPVVTGDMSIVAVKGGGEIMLTLGDLDAFDPDTDASEVVFTIDSINHGMLTFGSDRQPLSVDDSFTLDDIVNGRVFYRSVGDYVGQDHITLTLSDGVPGTPDSVVHLGATIVDAEFRVQTPFGYDFEAEDPIAKMGSGILVPNGSATDSFRILNSQAGVDFYITGYGFTFALDQNDNHVVTGGTITSIQIVSSDDDHAPIAWFGLAVPAVDWVDAAVAASHGDLQPIETLSRSWMFNFVGNTGADAFAAGDFNDIFSGRAGDDMLEGGAGLDRASYGGAAGQILVSLASGNVFEISADGQSLTGTDTLRSIEMVTGSNFNDGFDATGFGAVEQGVPIGQNHGSTVPGNAGGMFNEFEGRGGDDVIIGNGQTRISYYHATAGVSVTFIADSWTSAVSGGSGIAIGNASVGEDFFTGVNSVRGSFFDDTFTGSNNPAGSVENFEGLGGDDSIDGGLGFDRAIYSAASDGEGISVDLGAGTVTGGIDTGTDMLYSVEAIRGTNFSDYYDASTFSGSSANAGDNNAASSFNEFEGGGGDDTVIGNGNTRVSFAHASGGVVATLGADGGGEAVGGGSIGHDTFVSGVRHLRGSDFNDILTGNGANNRLEGQAGNDILDGRGGSDQLTGGAGADIFVFGPGSGSDTVTDFHAVEGDRLDLRAYHLSPTQISLFFQNNVTLVNGNADTLIDLGGGNTILLAGVHAGDIGFSDIVFNSQYGSSVAVSIQAPDGYDLSTLYDDLAAGSQDHGASNSSHLYVVNAAKGITFELIGVGFSYDPDEGVYTDGTITGINILDTADPAKTTQDHVLVNSSGWNVDPAALFDALGNYANVYPSTHAQGLAGLNAIFDAATYSYVGSSPQPNAHLHAGEDVFVGGSHPDVFNGLAGPGGLSRALIRSITPMPAARFR